MATRTAVLGNEGRVRAGHPYLSITSARAGTDFRHSRSRSRPDAGEYPRGRADRFPSGIGTSITLTQQFKTTRESTPVFALLAYHLPAGRLTVEVVGGLGIVHQSVTSSYESTISGPGLGPGGTFLPPPTRTEVKSSGYDAAAVVGADFAVAATNHLAVVPQVRAYVLNGGLSLRPGIGLRWTF